MRQRPSFAKRICFVIAAAYLAAGCIARPASAKIIDYTFSGSVADGYDHADLFGAGINLQGQTFRLVESFDTDASHYRYLDAQQSFQVGGSSLGAPLSATASLTIGTQTTTIADYSDYIFASSASRQIQEYVASGDGPGHAWVGFNIYSASITPDYASLPSLTGASLTFIGNFQGYDANGALATYADLRVDQLTVSDGSLTSVPLPGSLPLFAVGLLALAAGRILVLKIRSIRQQGHQRQKSRHHLATAM